MKKLILAAFLLTAVVSCSDDEPNNTTENGLLQTKQITYNNGSPEEVIITNFKNGQVDNMAFYTPENVLEFTTRLEYSSGLLTKVRGLNPNGQEAYSTSYVYDNQERLKTIQHNSPMYSYTVNYTFNNDNTISAVHSASETENKTFYVNSSGLIYKEITSSGYYELTFNGTNPVSGTSGFDTKTFTYDNEHDPTLLPHQILQDSYKPNAVLRARYLYDAQTSTANKYVTSEIGDNDNREYVRTFNAEGLPTLLKSYSNNVLYSQMEYIYN